MLPWHLLAVTCSSETLSSESLCVLQTTFLNTSAHLSLNAGASLPLPVGAKLLPTQMLVQIFPECWCKHLTTCRCKPLPESP